MQHGKYLLSSLEIAATSSSFTITELREVSLLDEHMTIVVGVRCEYRWRLRRDAWRAPRARGSARRAALGAARDGAGRRAGAGRAAAGGSRACVAATRGPPVARGSVRRTTPHSRSTTSALWYTNPQHYWTNPVICARNIYILPYHNDNFPSASLGVRFSDTSLLLLYTEVGDEV